MKRICMVVALVIMTMTPAYAGPLEGVELMMSSGVVFPASPMTFANYWNMQYGGAIGAGIPLSASITLIGSLEYYRFKLNEDGITDGFNTSYMRDIWVFKDVSLKPTADPSSVLTFSANVRIAPSELSGMVSPYVVAGGGLMHMSLSAITLPTTSVLSIKGSELSMTARQTITGGDETAAFYQFGIGVDVRVAETFVLYVEGRYSSSLDKRLGMTYVPVTAGVRIRI